MKLACFVRAGKASKENKCCRAWGVVIIIIITMKIFEQHKDRSATPLRQPIPARKI